MLVQVITAILLLLLGLSGCNAQATDSISLNTNPSTTMFISQSAAVMLSLGVNPQELRNYGTTGQKFTKLLEQFQQGLLANNNLTYQDFRPWLGKEITLALTSLDLDLDSSNGKQPGYLIAVTTKDPSRSKEFLEVFWQKQAVGGLELVYETFQGVKLIYPKNGSLFSSALVGDRYVLFANSPKVLREAINNVQAPNISIAQNTSYQEAIATFNQPGVALAYLNFPALVAWLNRGDIQGDISPLSNSILLSVALHNQDLIAQTALLPLTNQTLPNSEPSLNKTISITNYIPNQASLVIVGDNLNQLYKNFQERFSLDPLLSQLINNTIKNINKTSGIELDQDIFSWVDKNYALSLIPSSQGMNWVFITEKTAQVETGIANLDKIAQQQGLSVGTLPLGDRSISVWTNLQTTNTANQPVSLLAQVKGVHLELNNYLILSNSVAAINQVINAPNHSIATDSKFSKVLNLLPATNDGYFYLDWKNTQDYLEKQIPILSLIELFAQPIFNDLTTFTISSYGIQNNIQRAKLIIN